VKWGLDTSVTVRLLVGEPAAQAEAARRALSESAELGVVVSDLVIGESYFALRHHYRVPHAAVVRALRDFVADPRIHATGVARDVLAAASDGTEPPGLMDRLIHGDYRGLGAPLLTFDRDAARLEGARLLEA
jgi:predicted nucleic acid-binding protein